MKLGCAIKNNQSNNMQYPKNAKVYSKHFYPSVLQHKKSPPNNRTFALLSSPALFILCLVINEKIDQCINFKILEVLCKNYQLIPKMLLRNSIISIMLNVGANNFTMLLNRRENELKISMKMVKRLKKRISIPKITILLSLIVNVLQNGQLNTAKRD